MLAVCFAIPQKFASSYGWQHIGGRASGGLLRLGMKLIHEAQKRNWTFSRVSLKYGHTRHIGNGLDPLSASVVGWFQRSATI
jgi:hypothetical protein